MRKLIAALVLGGAVVTGCGQEEAGRFDDDVAEIRAAVAQGDARRAELALDALALDALAAAEDGVIGQGELDEIAHLLESARATVAELLPEATTTSPEPTTTATPSSAPHDAEGHGEGDDEKDGGDDDEDEDKGDKGDEGKGKGKKDD